MIPVFVYGTLKSDVPVEYTMLNVYGWDFLTRKKAVVKGNIYIAPFSKCTFPAVGELDTENSIYGELVYINDIVFMHILDQIESEGYMYKRIKTTTTDGEECWIYQWINIDHLENIIEHGNFQYIEIESTLCIPMKYENNQISKLYIPMYNSIINV